MNIPLPTPYIIKTHAPISTQQTHRITQYRKTIQNIVSRQDPRLLCVIGPCSVHHPESFLRYAHLFKTLHDQVQERLFLVLRAYYEKPRSRGGWTGFVYDPDINDCYDIAKGLMETRSLLVNALSLGLPLACEFLDPFTFPYFVDLIAWGSIGARTCYSQIHRQLASQAPCPIGFKNGIDGNITHAINSLYAAKASQYCIGINEHGLLTSIHTSGNPWCHLVLRGTCWHTNYESDHVQQAAKQLQHHRCLPYVMIDCAHDNSLKLLEHQYGVFETILRDFDQYNPWICGIMLESFLCSGNQPLSLALNQELSITDPCWSWEKTESAIHSLYNTVNDCHSLK